MRTAPHHSIVRRLCASLGLSLAAALVWISWPPPDIELRDHFAQLKVSADQTRDRTWRALADICREESQRTGRCIDHVGDLQHPPEHPLVMQVGAILSGLSGVERGGPSTAITDLRSMKQLDRVLRDAALRALTGGDAVALANAVAALKNIARLALLGDALNLPAAQDAVDRLVEIAKTADDASATQLVREAVNSLPSDADQLHADEHRELVKLVGTFRACSRLDTWPCTLDPNELAYAIQSYFKGVVELCTCETRTSERCRNVLAVPKPEEASWLVFHLWSPRYRQVWLSRNYARIKLFQMSVNAPKIRLARCVRLPTLN